MTPIIITEEAHRAALGKLGGYFKVARPSADLVAAGHLDPGKEAIAARQLEQFVALRGETVLEIGTGFGVNLADRTRRIADDGYGVEQPA